ncbi:hypothetical protein QOZ80_8AG0620240 [Eleusine coracana subsp. coracana]|nr:hypothetical protein QOZ80_8AG0620240 [Eleusine coracana subsp. coracana]
MEEQPSQTMVNEDMINCGTLAAYAANTYQPAPLVSLAPSAGAEFPPVSSAIQPQLFDLHEVVFQRNQQLDHNHLQQQLRAFWSCKLAEIEQRSEFKNHNLPLAKIKKIMKANMDVTRIAAEVPVLFAKACEMFIQDLALRGWDHTEEDRRRMLQKNDLSVALSRTEMFDFLADISPRDKLKGEVVGLPPPTFMQTMVPHWTTTGPLLPPPPLTKDDLKGSDMLLPKMTSMQYMVPQCNPTNSMFLMPPPIADKVTPYLHQQQWTTADPLFLKLPSTTDKVMPYLHLQNVEPELQYMASSPRKTHHDLVSLCTMDVIPSPLAESPERDWSELPLDTLSLIFMKLGTIEILMGAGLVCRSWLMAAKTPELWRFVDMTRHKLVFSKGENTMCAMAKVAIGRSQGQMESFWAQKFVTCELLDYIMSRANSLKSIRLVGCTYIWSESLSRFAAKCPLLEEIECSHHKMPAELFRYIGSVCPQLKRLRIHMQWFDYDQIMREIAMENRQNDEDEYDEPEESDEAWEARQNKDAFAIAESLHELRLLQMKGNSLTNKGVYAILDGCPSLDFLDIAECYHVDVNDELRSRCARLKQVWLPRERTCVSCPDLEVIGLNEGEDNGLTMHDLWLNEVESLHAEAAMDDDGSYGDYCECDCSSPDEPWRGLCNASCDGPRFHNDICDYDSL